MAANALALFFTTASAVCPPGLPESDGLPLDHAARPGGVTVVETPAGVRAPASEELERLYRSGIEFSEFYAGADRRRELWEKHYERGEIDPAMVERVRALGGTWRILAIAEAACSDSVGTIPFLSLLVERAPNLEMRIVGSDAGRAVMERHRTPDGRAATPTVLILDAGFDEAGCWIERPSRLQDWALGEGSELGSRRFLARKMAWYEEDAGASTIRELVELLEAAAAGAPICGAS